MRYAYGYFFVVCAFLYRKIVPAQSANTANVWLVQAKYRHTILKSTNTIPNTHANNGNAIIIRLRTGRWSRCRKSATTNRADRNAVSPEVIGAAITPIIAHTPPTVPNHERETLSTTKAAMFSPG